MAPATPTTLSDILDACEHKPYSAYVLDDEGSQSRVMGPEGRPMQFATREQALAHCKTLDVKDYRIWTRMKLAKPSFELTDEDLDYIAQNGVEVDVDA